MVNIHKEINPAMDVVSERTDAVSSIAPFDNPKAGVLIMCKRNYYFYVLKESISKPMRYFGRTVDVQNRLSGHISEARLGGASRKCTWIRSLQNNPIIQVVYEEACTIDESVQIEKTILRKLMRRFNLTNSWDNCLGAHKTGTIVHQYSLETGEYMNAFQNANHAAIELGTQDANILRACKRSSEKYGLSAGGHLWLFKKYNTYPFPLKQPPSHNMKGVNQYDLNGGFIASYPSAREAERQTGVGYKMISRVCRGIRPHTHGYKFNFQ